MHFSTFTAYFTQNAKHLTPATRRAVKAEAVERVTARLRADRADCELDFADLIARCEKEIAGA